MDRSYAWQRQREAIARRVEALRRQGICPSCHNPETGEPCGAAHDVYEDDLLRVELDEYSRARGHTIVLHKPHREDLSALAKAEAGRASALRVRLVKAIKAALGAEKVYLNTMCHTSS